MAIHDSITIFIIVYKCVIMDIHKSVVGIHDFVIGIHNFIMDSHNFLMKL